MFLTVPYLQSSQDEFSKHLLNIQQCECLSLLLSFYSQTITQQLLAHMVPEHFMIPLLENGQNSESSFCFWREGGE